MFYQVHVVLTHHFNTIELHYYWWLSENIFRIIHKITILLIVAVLCERRISQQGRCNGTKRLQKQQNKDQVNLV